MLRTTVLRRPPRPAEPPPPMRKLEPKRNYNDHFAQHLNPKTANFKSQTVKFEKANMKSGAPEKKDSIICR